MKAQNQNSQSVNKNGTDHRSDTRKHQYRNHDDVLTNDENYDVDTQKFIGEQPDWDDKLNNEEKN